MINIFCIISCFIVILGANAEKVDILILPLRLPAEKAHKACTKFGYNLVRVKNEEMNKFVLDLSIIMKLDRYWIDGNDNKEETVFENSDGQKLTYTRFKGDVEHNKSRNCLAGYFYKNEFWKDYKCISRLSTICYKPQTPKSKYTSIFSPKGAFILLNETRTFKEAQKFCNEAGLGVLKINNALTNKLVNRLATLFKLGKYWIDVNGMEKEVTYESSEKGKISFETELDLSTTDRTNNCVYETFGKKQNKANSSKYGSGRSNYGNRPKKSRYGKSKSDNSFWDDANCNDRHAIICN